MRMIRWNPRPLGASNELSTLHGEVDQLLSGFFSRGAQGEGSLYSPAMDVEETTEEFVVRADVPGVSQKDVKVSLIGDTLTIRGERRNETESHKGTAHRVERSYGAFERSFTLGTAVRQEGVQAKVKDGVLEVHVPKADEAKLREIEVQVG